MAKKKDEMLELAKKQSDALLEADMAALDEQTQRETADALALDALAQAHAAESAAQSAYNQAQYANVGQILNDIQGKIDTAKQKDETALKREKAFRYISGLGDTLSGVANLVGTAHGASNQNQTYNSHAVVQKAEEARKARKLEMDDLSKRLDEMQTRQRDLKAAGSLAEAQLKAKQDRERLELEASQRKAADEAKRDADNKAYRAMRDARQDFVTDRAYEESSRQFDATQERLANNAAADRQSREEIKKLELAAKAAKEATDPKTQARVLQSNITGIRDELAKRMGYSDYNEYLRYQNVEGWGTDIEGQRNKDSKDIRKRRASENPEVEEFLNLLSSPETLTEEQIRMLAGASSVFADAIGNAGAAPAVNPNNGKKKVW